MRNIKNIYLISGLAALMSSCAVHLQNYTLGDEYATSMHIEGTEGKEKTAEADEKADLVGVPAKSYYGGDIKRGAIWWAGKGISLEKGNVFIIDAINVGPDNIPFGATFPPLDLIKEEVVLKISARAEGKNGQIPELHLQVDDASGYQTNANRPFQKIENSTEFKNYYFDLRGIYMQSEPKKHKVNGALINSLKFFINPGQIGYTGKIFIQEIKVVSASEMEQAN